MSESDQSTSTTESLNNVPTVDLAKRFKQERDRLMEEDSELRDLKSALLSKAKPQDIRKVAFDWGRTQLKEKYRYKYSNETRSRNQKYYKYRIMLGLRSRIEYLEDFLEVPVNDLKGKRLISREARWLTYFDTKRNDSQAKEIIERIENNGCNYDIFCKCIEMLYGDFSSRAAHRIPLPKKITESNIDEVLKLIGVVGDQPVKVALKTLITPLGRTDDEEKKYDPAGFRDVIVPGLCNAKSNVEAMYNYLESAGSHLDFCRYGGALFDILISGGLLLTRGSNDRDCKKQSKTNSCIFKAPSDIKSMKNFKELFAKLMERHRFLKEMFPDVIRNFLKRIDIFKKLEQMKLARMTALWISSDAIDLQVLLVLLKNKHAVMNGSALEFLIEVFVTWKQEPGLSSLKAALKKEGLEKRLMEFMPPNKRTEDCFRTAFEQKGLLEIVPHSAPKSADAERSLELKLATKLAKKAPIEEIIKEVQTMAGEATIPNEEVLILIWSTIMYLTEWNTEKKLPRKQASTYLEQYTKLFTSFATSIRSQFVLMSKVLEYCQKNRNAAEAFVEIIDLFYRKDIVIEKVILKWYKERRSSIVESEILQPTEKFIKYLLENSEESSTNSDETSCTSSAAEPVNTDDTLSNDSKHNSNEIIFTSLSPPLMELGLPITKLEDFKKLNENITKSSAVNLKFTEVIHSVNPNVENRPVPLILNKIFAKGFTESIKYSDIINSNVHKIIEGYVKTWPDIGECPTRRIKNRAYANKLLKNWTNGTAEEKLKILIKNHHKANKMALKPLLKRNYKSLKEILDPSDD